MIWIGMVMIDVYIIGLVNELVDLPRSCPSVVCGSTGL